MIDVEVAIWLVHLVGRTRVGVVAGYELHDVKTHALDTKITGRAQYATCITCRKTIASWRARPFAMRSRANKLDPNVEAQLRAHSPACVGDWMWRILAKWSTGFASAEESEAIVLWRERYVEGVLSRANMRDVFTRLPAPPGSEIAQEIEVALIAISRLW
ncbi:MAG TPA: hypothetical protein VGC41_11355 [Kofleriaceae bacterium]